jgi:hypothetical protein
MKEEDRTIVLDAAQRIDAAAHQLGAAYRELSEGLARAGRAAYHERGKNAAEDFSAVVGQGRVTEEVAGLLVAVGMADVLKVQLARSVVGVDDFYPRWKARIDALPEHSSRSHPVGAKSHV